MDASAEPLRVEDDFAELLALLEQFVGLGALCERHDAVDHGAELALADQLEHRVDLGRRRLIKKKKGELPAEQVANIDFVLVAGRRPAGHQPPAATPPPP